MTSYLIRFPLEPTEADRDQCGDRQNQMKHKLPFCLENENGDRGKRDEENKFAGGTHPEAITKGKPGKESIETESQVFQQNCFYHSLPRRMKSCVAGIP